MKQPKIRSYIGQQFPSLPDANPRKYLRRQRFQRRMERKHYEKTLRLLYS